MKTPEEIKRGLLQCSEDEDGCNCEGCPYDMGEFTCKCIPVSQKDALTLIQQLENHIGELTEMVQQLERERDAAVAETESLKTEIDAINEDYLSGIHTVREDAQPKWISVEERLPDDLEEVLILVKETELYGQYNEFSRSYFCQYIGSLDDGEWYTVWCNGYRYIKDTAKEPNADKLEVTHWMPLPSTEGLE
ncbi:MAG: DUF551 domain-containing protein [Clostridia bacterium]|nr:DUF551 domain-containing protein [Clostridia bacterium]